MLTVNKPLPTTAQPRSIDPATTCALSKREKARIAADVLNGTAAFKWTVPTLSKLLGVCASYIQQEKLTAERVSPDLLTTWQRADEDERAAFLSAVADSLWFAGPVPQPRPSNGHARRHPMQPPIVLQAAE